jgi:hypothetical protein
LYRWFEDLPLPPDLHHPSQLLLHLVGCTFICRCGGFGNDWGEGEEEVILATSLRLLNDFCGREGISVDPLNLL